jgi:ABC-type multidrug transport system fused ATPase/permease subunit
MIDDLAESEGVRNFPDAFNSRHIDFLPKVVINNLNLTYFGRIKPALSEINLEIETGSVTAIVGPSGAGKTSLIDVILGVVTPTSGEVLISGINSKLAIERWPGALSYVPQDISIANRTIAENIALGFKIEEIEEARLWEVLKIAQLEDIVRALPEGIHTKVGDRGAKLSGGQRQRLGIARALITKPQLLVLDEATSSLDGQSEMDVSDAIKELKGSVTVLMIAHRLSTVRSADQVIYMEEGEILARGTFGEVRAKIPDFDQQAKLMGL